VRGDNMLIDIEPALSGQRFGLGATDITQLIISARHRGQTLYPISEWPFFVYVGVRSRKEISEMTFPDPAEARPFSAASLFPSNLMTAWQCVRWRGTWIGRSRRPGSGFRKQATRMHGGQGRFEVRVRCRSV